MQPERPGLTRGHPEGAEGRKAGQSFHPCVTQHPNQPLCNVKAASKFVSDMSGLYGEPYRVRTYDLVIKSHLLYQLS
jgi:hypothetical protein